MKSVKRMSLLELAAYVQTRLRAQGIQVVLSGGASVSFYSSNKYLSHDLDLINVNFVKRKQIKLVMEANGFSEKGRHFTHPDSAYFIEFPDGPLSVGEEPVKEINEVKFATGILSIISATDCVKDRLCAFYYWNDLVGLEQAILVSRDNKIDFKELKRWSIAEGKLDKFIVFKHTTTKKP